MRHEWRRIRPSDTSKQSCAALRFSSIVWRSKQRDEGLAGRIGIEPNAHRQKCRCVQATCPRSSHPNLACGFVERLVRVVVLLHDRTLRDSESVSIALRTAFFISRVAVISSGSGASSNSVRSSVWGSTTTVPIAARASVTAASLLSLSISLSSLRTRRGTPSPAAHAIDHLLVARASTATPRTESILCSLYERDASSRPCRPNAQTSSRTRIADALFQRACVDLHARHLLTHPLDHLGPVLPR